MSFMTTDVTLLQRDERIKQLERELSLAEEGLANYAQENKDLVQEHARFVQEKYEALAEVERLRALLTQAPIAKVTVRESGAGHYAPDDVSVSLYAPGLPPGEHDLYLMPSVPEWAATEIERLRAALREVYEVWAGSDGFIPETAAEGYQQRLILQMRDAGAKGLGVQVPQSSGKALQNLEDAREGLANYPWQPIETAPERVEALFWIRPGTREDGDWYTDSSGNPILAYDVPRIFMGQRGSWSSLMKATRWMPLPAPPQPREHKP